MGPLLRIQPWAEVDDGQHPSAAVRLGQGLRDGEDWAVPAMVDVYGGWVERVLLRVLGGDVRDLRELAQDVFVRAWRGAAGLEKPEALKPWLTRIAVFTARAEIRRRQRQRWLNFMSEPPQTPAPSAPTLVEEAAQAVYQILDAMPADERIPFALHKIEGFGLVDAADACEMSLSTLRRRLKRAERRFFKMARDHEALRAWLDDESGDELDDDA